MRNHSYENDFDLHENETTCRTHFHKNGFALRLALKQRHKGTRKWPILFAFLNSMHKVYFRFHINKMYFGENVMITFELQHGCTKPKGMTVREKLANLELTIEFFIRVESSTLEQTNELCTCILLGGVTSQLAHAWNRATFP